MQSVFFIEQLLDLLVFIEPILVLALVCAKDVVGR